MDAARFLIGRRAVIVQPVDELFMLGADAPFLGGFFALGECRDQLITAFDDRVCPL